MIEGTIIRFVLVATKSVGGIYRGVYPFLSRVHVFGDKPTWNSCEIVLQVCMYSGERLMYAC